MICADCPFRDMRLTTEQLRSSKVFCFISSAGQLPECMSGYFLLREARYICDQWNKRPGTYCPAKVKTLDSYGASTVRARCEEAAGYLRSWRAIEEGLTQRRLRIQAELYLQKLIGRLTPFSQLEEW